MPFEVGKIENAQAGQRAALAHLTTLPVAWPGRSKKVTFPGAIVQK